MKPTYARRYRPRTAVHCEGKKNCHENFFGDPGQDRFFQPSIYSTQASTIHRKCEHCEQEEKQQVHRAAEGVGAVSAAGPVAGGVSAESAGMSAPGMEGSQAAGYEGVSGYIRSLPGKGEPLPAAERQFFEARMGYDLSEVRIHTGAEAARSAKAVNAKAYTTGREIVFNKGRYDLSSGEGKKLMAHELTHVMQGDDRVQREPEKKEPEKTATPKPVSAPTQAPATPATTGAGSGTTPVQQDKTTDKAKVTSPVAPPTPYLKDKGIGSPEQRLDQDDSHMRKYAVVALGQKGKLSTYLDPKLDKLKDDKTTPIKLLDPEQFGAAYLKYAKKRNPGTPDADPSLDNAKRATGVGGFYEPTDRTIYVRMRGSFCDFFHEAIHSFSDPDLLMNHIGKDLMEGLTAYYTNIIFNEQLKMSCKLEADYQKYLKCATDFVTVFGDRPVAELFFNGNTAIDAEIMRVFGLPNAATLAAVGKGNGLCGFLERHLHPTAPPAVKAVPAVPHTAPAPPAAANPPKK